MYIMKLIEVIFVTKGNTVNKFTFLACIWQVPNARNNILTYWGTSHELVNAV